MKASSVNVTLVNMAERGRSVRVTGLPTEIKEDRLEDKLCIHFQRASNGGGEVVSVTTVKTPDVVLVTFEDSRVAQRVIQHNPQILEVDGNKYNLIVTDPCGNQNQDKVIIHLSATVDCSQLSGAKRTLKSLHESHPDVQMKYSSTKELCSLSGSYSKVQAALEQLLGHPERPHTAENKDLRPRASSDHKPVSPMPLPHTQVSGNQSRSPREKREREGPIAGKQRSSLHRDITPGGYDTGQVEGATASSPASDEDFSLMVDADMFQYLQKHCSEEYHQILRQHGVAVVDFTHQGLTTLLLQVASEEDIQDQECLRKARMEISTLYEKNQANVCREKLSKIIIPTKEGRKRAVEKLSGRFPKLLLNEDDQNIYFIGSRDDVKEAKQFLLFYDDSKDNKTDVSSPRRLLDSLPADEGKIPIGTSSTSGFLDNGLDQVLRSGEDEGRADTASKYKLAAQFKDSRLTPLGSKTDFTVRGISHLNRQTRQVPMLGYDVLSDTKGSAHVKVGAQNTGGDIFRSGDVLQNKMPWTTDLEDTRPKGSTVSPFQSDGLGSFPQSPAISGSSLRRTSSFSGTTQKKTQEISPKSLDDSDKPTTKSRGRSSSFNNGSKTEQYSAEITVNELMWRHISEAYKHWIEEKMSGVTLRERRSEGSEELTLVLTGTDSTKVTTSQLGLQKIIDSVGVDFVFQTLPLSKLGVTNKTDETLLACCAEIRGLYKKITMYITENNLLLLGPKMLCSQVCASLQEVFSGPLISKQEDFSRLSTSSGNDSYSNSPLTSNSQTGKAAVTDGSKRKDLWATELVNGSTRQLSPRKDPVIREKVRRPATVEMDAHNIQESFSFSKSNNISGSGTARSDKSTSEKRQQTGGDVKASARESTTAVECPVCMLKKVGVEMKRTDCGVTLCSDCLVTSHSQCRVCEKKEPTPSGIQGKMTYSKLPMSVPGYMKDPVVKITYCIPDGIQGKDHPSPGKPFKGGVFEAFLPDCTMTRNLLPRLQEAFNRGLTFTVLGSKVTWDCIPHKTHLQGGRPTNGYPDSSYLKRLSDVLTSYGIE